MTWFNDAKFGMFIHWGPGSVKGFDQGIATLCSVGECTALAREFRAERFDPRGWARLAKRAGMKYMVLTAKHHDGFALFDSRVSDFTSVKMGPKRDLVRDFVDSAREEGMRIGLYYSIPDYRYGLAETGNRGGKAIFTNPPKLKAFRRYTHTQARELLTNYGKIDVLWWDMGGSFDGREVSAMARTLQPHILMNNRAGVGGDFRTPENCVRAFLGPWEACQTINSSWFFNEHDQYYKTSEELLLELLSCVRKGGNYLLNIGPKPDGTIPKKQITALSQIGKWVRPHSEAVYGTRPLSNDSLARSPWGWFAAKDGKLYFYVLHWPGEGDAVVTGLRSSFTKARILANGTGPALTRSKGAAVLKGLPRKAPARFCSVIVLE